MEIKFTNPISDPDWDRLAVSHPDASFFHSAAWAEVLSKTYGHEPLYLRCFERDKLVGLVPIMEVRSPLTGRRGVCLPFTDFAVPFCLANLLRRSLGMRYSRWLGTESGNTLRSAAEPILRFRPNLPLHSMVIRSICEAALQIYWRDLGVLRAVRSGRRTVAA